MANKGGYRRSIGRFGLAQEVALKLRALRNQPAFSDAKPDVTEKKEKERYVAERKHEEYRRRRLNSADFSTDFVNRHDRVNKTYTGSRRSSLSLDRAPSNTSMKSGKSVHKTVTSVKPFKREGYSVGELQKKIYTNIHNTYGVSPTDTKQKQFFERLATMKLDNYRLRYMNLSEKERVIVDDHFKKLEKLKYLNDKFQKFAVELYHSQFEKGAMIDKKFRNISAVDRKFNYTFPGPRPRLPLKPVVPRATSTQRPYHKSQRKHLTKGKADGVTSSALEDKMEEIKKETENLKLSRRELTTDVKDALKEAEHVIALCDNDALRKDADYRHKSNQKLAKSSVPGKTRRGYMKPTASSKGQQQPITSSATKHSAPVLRGREIKPAFRAGLAPYVRRPNKLPPLNTQEKMKARTRNRRIRDRLLETQISNQKETYKVYGYAT